MFTWVVNGNVSLLSKRWCSYSITFLRGPHNRCLPRKMDFDWFHNIWSYFLVNFPATECSERAIVSRFNKCSHNIKIDPCDVRHVGRQNNEIFLHYNRFHFPEVSSSNMAAVEEWGIGNEVFDVPWSWNASFKLLELTLILTVGVRGRGSSNTKPA